MVPLWKKKGKQEDKKQEPKNNTGTRRKSKRVKKAKEGEEDYDNPNDDQDTFTCHPGDTVDCDVGYKFMYERSNDQGQKVMVKAMVKEKVRGLVIGT